MIVQCEHKLPFVNCLRLMFESVQWVMTHAECSFWSILSIYMYTDSLTQKCLTYLMTHKTCILVSSRWVVHFSDTSYFSFFFSQFHWISQYIIHPTYFVLSKLNKRSGYCLLAWNFKNIVILLFRSINHCYTWQGGILCSQRKKC